MSTLSQVSSIVTSRAAQAEAQIRETIRRNVRAVQEHMTERPSPKESRAYTVNISLGAIQKAAGL
ncbi:MAG: hypothetical protein H7839_09910 [Magnetococcus sp. YQC-5]